MTTANAALSADRLPTRDLRRLAEFIQDYSGIRIPETKRVMVEGRLRRRMRATGHHSLAEYCRFLFDDGGLEDETIHLIDAITTNKTDFFREPDHFRFLADTGVTELLASRRGQGAALKIWSAAASIGAEAYSLLMLLNDLSTPGRSFKTTMFGTDICTKVLETAHMAIYPHAMIQPVPMEMRRRYLLKSKKKGQDLVRIVPELRQMLRLGRLNLMDQRYPMDSDMDAIFCRNILIYFDKPTQHAVLDRLCEHLRPGGLLFLGLSESLAGHGLPVEPVGPSIFRRI